jgi:glycyl-tRNA synthetase beta chain
MGKYYAQFDEEENEVAIALEEQYLPAHSGGKLPQTDTGALLSITDKMDNIAAFFSIGLIPTGSEDPFAHRRQALGIIAIILNKGYDLPLRGLVDTALKALPHVKDPRETGKKIFLFFQNRLESVFADMGYPPDVIQSLISLSTDVELGEIKERLDAVKKFREAGNFNDFLAAIKRVNNIIPKTAVPEVNTALLVEAPEKKLRESLDAVRADLPGLLQARRHDDSISLLTSLTGPINDFFDGVMVMDKREEIKANRLSLLNEIWKTIASFADFSKLSAGQDQ